METKYLFLNWGSKDKNNWIKKTKRKIKSLITNHLRINILKNHLHNHQI